MILKPLLTLKLWLTRRQPLTLRVILKLLPNKKVKLLQLVAHRVV